MQELTMKEVVAATAISPQNAGNFFGEFLKRKKITPNKAAKMMGYESSTIYRLIKGGSLTINMAANIHRCFGLNIQLLFNMEAIFQIHIAENLLNTETRNGSSRFSFF